MKNWYSRNFLVPEFSILQYSVWKFSVLGFYFPENSGILANLFLQDKKFETALRDKQKQMKFSFSPILRLQEQQNFRNLEFRREILEFSEKSFHFYGGNLEFPLSLEEKS